MALLMADTRVEASLLGARLQTMGCPLCLDDKAITEAGSTRIALLEWLFNRLANGTLDAAAVPETEQDKLERLAFLCELLGLWHQSYESGSTGVQQLVEGSCSSEVSLRFVSELTDLAAASLQMDAADSREGFSARETQLIRHVCDNQQAIFSVDKELAGPKDLRSAAAVPMAVEAVQLMVADLEHALAERTGQAELSGGEVEPCDTPLLEELGLQLTHLRRTIDAFSSQANAEALHTAGRTSTVAGDQVVQCSALGPLSTAVMEHHETLAKVLSGLATMKRSIEGIKTQPSSIPTEAAVEKHMFRLDELHEDCDTIRQSISLFDLAQTEIA